MASLFKDMLRNEGIDCLVKNDQLVSAMGEIPFTECLPELWLVDEEVYPRARYLLKQWMDGRNDRGAWVCPHCREKLEQQFDICWSCGCERP